MCVRVCVHTRMHVHMHVYRRAISWLTTEGISLFSGIIVNLVSVVSVVLFQKVFLLSCPHILDFKYMYI